jgi:sialate O-acetylesterase
MKPRPCFHLVCILIVCCVSKSFAEITLPKILGSEMVLQRELSVPIWGHASPGERVTVRFAGQEKSATADADGKWRVNLDPMSASDQPRDLTISGSTTIELKNLLVGEVWLCSGQSNMELPMGRGPAYHVPRSGPDPMPGDLASCADPNIRLFRVEKKDSLPELTTVAGWTECNPKTLNSFSAVGYYFGKNLRADLKVPIGLIQSAWGGQRIEPFTPPEAYLSMPEFKIAPSTPPTTPPSTQPMEIDGIVPGKHYRSMIQPMIPFAIRGAIWYQGESNLIDAGDGAQRYADKMKVMIDSWRSAWGEGNFPFYYVQIAPFKYSTRKDKLPHTILSEPKIWEGQMMALSIPNTGMAATVDIVDNVSDIHPPEKWDVGRRLELWALAKDYGHKDLEVCGPLYKKIEIQNSQAKISFDHIGAGLISRDGKPLTGFTIAGADHQFQPAEAKIDGDVVVVSSTTVPAPAAVRYAWEETPTTNLANKEGLPAFPFRTDGEIGQAH